MSFKFLLFLVAAVGAASLQDIHPQSQQQQQQQQNQQQQQPQHRYAAETQDQNNDEQIGYDFSYSVQDPVTGDIKNQEESRRNGNVRGHYSWVDADGNRQIVDYRADDHNGFTSEHRQEPAVRPRPPHIWIRAPLYTINTILAPVHTSSSRVDHHRQRQQQQQQQDNRDDRDESGNNRDNQDNRDNRDDRDNREQHDGQQDNRDERDRENQSSRDNQDGRDNQNNNRDNRDDRDNRDGRENRDSSEQRSNRDDRDRSRDERRGAEGHAQSEVRFQDPVVSYQYSS